MAIPTLGNVAHRPFDLIVVGGGIHGSLTHLLATLAGLESVLLERGDFGGGASWNTSRILHGGIRYLQTGNVRRVRSSLAARRWFFRVFPEFTSVLPCLLPVYDRGVRRRSALSVATLLHNVLAYDGNRGVPASHHFPPGRMVGVDETVSALSLVRREGLRGSATWSDGLLANPPRVLMEVLNWSEAEGGTALNYVEVEGISTREGRVTGVEARDTVTGAEAGITAPRVVLCTGAGRPEGGLKGASPEGGRALDFAFNLVLDRSPPAGHHAVAVDPARGRGHLFFLVPLGEMTLAGTRHLEVSGPPPSRPPRKEAEEMLQGLNSALPGWDVDSDTIHLTLGGMIPEKPLADEILDHASTSLPPGAVHVRSAKYTTAPVTAHRVMERILGKAPPKVEPDSRPPSRRVVTAREFLREYPRNPLAVREWVETICREERVLTPEDFILRRTDWALDARSLPEVREVLGQMEDLMGASKWEDS